jgi:uncharacterized protein YggU (UPF0235/DUF167 family)
VTAGTQADRDEDPETPCENVHKLFRYVLTAGATMILRPRSARGHEGELSRREGHTDLVRITIRVRPGSTRPGVGGEHGGMLVVRVREHAVDGKATAAAVAAVAAAFGVRPHAVTLVAGASSPTKILEVEGADRLALEQLLLGR